MGVFQTPKRFLPSQAARSAAWLVPPPTTLLSLGNRLAVVGGGFLISFKYKVFQRGGAVSAAASGPAPRWGASRTDRSGNGDRRWTVATGDHRPPLYPPARGRSHLLVRSAQNALHRRAAPPCNPSTRRMSLSCREFRGCETRPSKLHEVQLDSCAHPPRKGVLGPSLLQKGFQRGMKSPFEKLIISKNKKSPSHNGKPVSSAY